MHSFQSYKLVMMYGSWFDYIIEKHDDIAVVLHCSR